MQITSAVIERAFEASKKNGKKHILITGSRGSGKTTLFASLTTGITCGIKSKRENDNCVTMSDFAERIKFQIGYHLENTKGMTPCIKNIKTNGVHLLESCICSHEQNVAIDEIGFLECECHPYCQTLEKLFDTKNVIACVRKDNYEFLNKILSREDAFVVDLDNPFDGLGCIVLASGLSTRFGSNKLMATLKEKPVIAHIIEKVIHIFDAKNIKPIVITRYDEIATLCEIYKINFVLHDLPHKSDTIRLGVEALEKKQGYIFCQADQPLVTEETLMALALSWKNDKGSIWRISFDGEDCTPVIFPGKFYDELRNLPQNSGGNVIIKANEEIIKRLEAKNEFEVLDIDGQSDLVKLKEICKIWF